MIFAVAAAAALAGLLVQDGLIHRRDTGALFPLYGMQWESQLRYESRLADYRSALVALGATETVMTVYGGDDPTINILTASNEKRAVWRNHVALLNQKGIVATVYLSELEHADRKPEVPDLTTEQRIAIAHAVVDVFGGLTIIPVLGEEFTAGAVDGRVVANVFREREPGWLIATHNAVEKDYAAWAEATDPLVDEGRIDLILVQGFAYEVPAAVTRWKRNGVAVVAHEERPWQTGTTVGSLAAWARTAAETGCAGFSVYPGANNGDGCHDLLCPDPSPYLGEFRAAVRSLPALLAYPDPGWAADTNRDGVTDVSDALLRANGPFPLPDP